MVTDEEEPVVTSKALLKHMFALAMVLATFYGKQVFVLHSDQLVQLRQNQAVSIGSPVSHVVMTETPRSLCR